MRRRRTWLLLVGAAGVVTVLYRAGKAQFRGCTMRWIAVGVVVGVFATGAAWAKRDAATVYVDCAASPGGDGSALAPLPTITQALPVARALSVTHRVTIDVAEGICAAETLPMTLDFPVHVRGAREYDLDASRLPTSQQMRDTLITWTPPALPAPAAAFRPIFFEITSSGGVDLSHLSIDGARPPGGDTFAMNAPGPTGIRALLGSAFDIEGVRLMHMEAAIHSRGGSGRIRESYLFDVGAPLQLFGAPDDGTGTGATVVVRNNRIKAYRIYGLAAAGGGFGGTHLDLVVEDNDFQTEYHRTGPSNPAGLRISPAVLNAPYGVVRGTFARNRIRGPIPYPIMLHGGQPERVDGAPPASGEMHLSFEDNVYDQAASEGTSLVTFTNPRATELTCELNPPTTPSCSGLPGAAWWAYLERALYDVHHTGELNVVRIDHPEFDPIDGSELGNTLRLNGQVVPYETFVVVP